LSARVRRRQNRMTVLCILMAVLLVTAIFSMADMAIRMETERVIDTHGHWHAMLRSLPEETADAITAEPEVKAFARYDGLNFALAEDYTMDGKPCVVVGGDEAILTEIYDDLAEGHFPQSPDEILLSRRAKAMLSVEVGDQVTLHTPAGEFVYTISGFGADVTISSDASVVGAVLNWDAFASLADAEGYTMAPVWFVRLQDGANARKVLDRWRQQYGLTDETLSENTALLGLSGFSSDSYVMGMYLVAAVLFVLVLAAGVFMIAGSLNSQTAQRTQFYGMLRCIGASKAQIMHLVRWEASTGAGPPCPWGWLSASCSPGDSVPCCGSAPGRSLSKSPSSPSARWASSAAWWWGCSPCCSPPWHRPGGPQGSARWRRSAATTAGAVAPRGPCAGQAAVWKLP
ncbi:MAG: ABC transporter permease, partial [Gemmiger sp.]|uniref:ABC transporter permease n=1 Tax=Gemmiger sp. TaxID=2049027 RepID=UPI002E7781D1